MPSLQIIYASTSGHTEYVVGELAKFLKEAAPALKVNVLRVEKAQPEDLLKGDVLLLASGTWNTGGPEGQLNPHMHLFLRKHAKDADLHRRNVAVVALGDRRYYYTANARVHLEQFVRTHGGKLLVESLRIVNEPYGQEETVKKWGKKLVVHLQNPKSEIRNPKQ